MLELAEAELIADGKRNKAECGLGDQAHGLYLCHRAEAETGDTDASQCVGAQKDAGNQIGCNGGQADQFGETGEKQTAQNGSSQGDQIEFHGIVIFFQ